MCKIPGMCWVCASFLILLRRAGTTEGFPGALRILRILDSRISRCMIVEFVNLSVCVLRSKGIVHPRPSTVLAALYTCPASNLYLTASIGLHVCWDIGVGAQGYGGDVRPSHRDLLVGS